MRGALVAAVVTLAACKPAPRSVLPNVGTITLAISNVHVVTGHGAPLIIDSGAGGEIGEIEKGVAALGVDLAKVRCAVITHAHSDHAGNARALQQRGVKIVIGSGDVAAAQLGDHEIHDATSLFATMLRWYLPRMFAPFTPDFVVTKTLDLSAPCGTDAEVIATPGHTPGSVVVLLDKGKTALVGDLFRGGRAYGMFSMETPREHFYQEDLAAAHAQIHALLARGVEWFVLGHGGPSSRADVEEEFGK